MKIIITEEQAEMLMGGNPPNSVIYTDKKKYKKALEDYEKCMKLYEFSLRWKSYDKKCFSQTRDKISEKYENDPYIKYIESMNLSYENYAPTCVFSLILDRIGQNSECYGRLNFNKKETLKKLGAPKIKGYIRFVLGGCDELPLNNDSGTSKNGEARWTFYIPIIEKPIKPIYEEPNLKPESPKKVDLINQIQPKKIPELKINTELRKPSNTQSKTNFVVQWAENGKQVVKYFNTFEDWNKFVDSISDVPFIQKNVNGNKTQASVSYYTNPLK